MGMWNKVSSLCLGLCFLCIILSTVLAVLAIWGVVSAKETLGKALGTLGVVFLGSLATPVVKKATYYSTTKSSKKESKKA